MPEVLVLNPRRRGRNRLGRFVKNTRKSRRRRRNPIAALAANPRHRRRRRRNPIAAFAANPRRRRRRNARAIGYTSGRGRIRRRKLNPRYRRRYRRNPGMSVRSLLSVRGLTATLMPAAIGGVGALGLDLALARIPLPDWFQTPTGKLVTRIAGAVGLGFVASFVVPKRTAVLFTSGALTVTAYGAIKELQEKFFPMAGISPPPYGDYSDTRLGYLDPAPRLGAYMQRSAPMNSGVGAYMRDTLDNVNALSGVTSDGL